MNEHSDIFSWLEWIVLRGSLLILLIIGAITVLIEAIKFLTKEIKSFKSLWKEED